MNDHEKRQAYQLSEPITETEYGIAYPDGSLSWDRGLDIDTPEGRALFREDREQRERYMHLTPSPITFMQRTSRTEFSAVRPVAP